MTLLFKMLCRRKYLSVAAVCASMLAAAETLWWNAELSGIINTVSEGKAPDKKTVICSLVIMLFMGLTNYAKSYMSGYACESMSHDLRTGYARNFALLSVAESEKLNAGEQLSKLQNEISAVTGYLNSNLYQLIDDCVRFITTFIWLLLINPALTLPVNLPSFILIGYVFWSSKVIGAATLRSQQAKGSMNQYADTLLTLFPVIRLYDAVRMTSEGYKDSVKTWEKYTVRAERIRARLCRFQLF
jgi:ABC-type multidrug transport system fused ATPase/permease subunit